MIYDALYKAMFMVPNAVIATPPTPPLLAANGEHDEKPETRIELRTFQYFLSEIATWARDEKVVSNGFQVCHYLQQI
jgi:TBC1 domain family member 8/9